MKRKINKVGQNTLTISLPNTWVKKNQIKPGEELEVLEDGPNLHVTRNKKWFDSNRAIVNVEHMSKFMLNRTLSALYTYGFQEIEVRYKEQELFDYKTQRKVSVEDYIKELLTKLLGLEVISHSKDKILLHAFIKDFEPKELEMTIRRIYYLTKEFLDSFIVAMQTDFEPFFQRYYLFHDNISKFNFYSQRMLYLSDYDERVKGKIFALLTLIDKTMDTIRHLAERVNELKHITKTVQEELKNLFIWFLRLFEFYLSETSKMEEFEDIVKERYLLMQHINKTKFPHETERVISEAKWILDCMNEFIEASIYLHIDNFKSNI
ncbi:AbrB/MazE/SpoVT family DNA-binding domain-containing protein [Candidatus Woesearchaeota archaeon]|nr:AbrB/MazE/SpoVT family DNA-binding domain-containing protein [Candidatus Woesearchaeota archaeon]